MTLIHSALDAEDERNGGEKNTMENGRKRWQGGKEQRGTAWRPVRPRTQQQDNEEGGKDTQMEGRGERISFYHV